jgi:hypothetical protein
LESKVKDEEAYGYATGKDEPLGLLTLFWTRDIPIAVDLDAQTIAPGEQEQGCEEHRRPISDRERRVSGGIERDHRDDPQADEQPGPAGHKASIRKETKEQANGRIDDVRHLAHDLHHDPVRVCC